MDDFPQPSSHLPVPVAAPELPAMQAPFEPDAVKEQLPAAIEAAGGAVLFQLTPPEDENVSWVAAVSFGSGEARRLAIVSVAAEDGVARVEPAEESHLPVARIVESYAGLLDRLNAAA